MAPTRPCCCSSQKTVNPLRRTAITMSPRERIGGRIHLQGKHHPAPAQKARFLAAGRDMSRDKALSNQSLANYQCQPLKQGTVTAGLTTTIIPMYPVGLSGSGLREIAARDVRYIVDMGSARLSANVSLPTSQKHDDTSGPSLNSSDETIISHVQGQESFSEPRRDVQNPPANRVWSGSRLDSMSRNTDLQGQDLQPTRTHQPRPAILLRAVRSRISHDEGHRGRVPLHSICLHRLQL